MLFKKNTYTYKKINNCEIQADVFIPKNSANGKAILWLHPGGLIFGSREMLLKEQLELYIKCGFTVISLDYRLAPETKLIDIIQDVQDGYNWILEQGPKLFNIDPKQISIIGHSAGGYLALNIGCFSNPKPLSIVTFYGYGDITGDWYSKPDPNYLKEPIVTKELAFRGVNNEIVSCSNFTGFNDPRWLFYLYLRQQGLWLNEVTGFNISKEPEKFNKYCPAFNVTPEFPPTMLIHGNQDTDVPFTLSEQMARVLENKKVPNKLIILDRLGHMFDRGPDTSIKGSKEIKQVFDSVINFLNEI